MKKKMFLTVVLCSITASGIFAQESIKIEKNSDKGMYVRFGGGYSLGMGKTSGGANGLMPSNNTLSISSSTYQSRYGTVNADESSSTTTKTNAAFSLGEGINMSVGVGYMFNPNIGLEISGGYLLSTSTVENNISSDSYQDVSVSSGNNTTKRTITENSSSNITTNKMKRTCFSLTPAVKFLAPIGEKVSIYSRIGVVIPVSDKMVYEYSGHIIQKYRKSTNNDGVNTNSRSNELKTMEFEPYFRVGYAAAIGVNYPIGKNVCFFGEINGVSDTFEAKKSIITEWTKTSNTDGNIKDSNLLSGLNTCDIETEYLKEYIVDNKKTSSTDKNKPKKDVSFSLPASNIGLAIGLAFKF